MEEQRIEFNEVIATDQDTIIMLDSVFRHSDTFFGAVGSRLSHIFTKFVTKYYEY